MKRPDCPWCQQGGKHDLTWEDLVRDSVSPPDTAYASVLPLLQQRGHRAPDDAWR